MYLYCRSAISTCKLFFKYHFSHFSFLTIHVKIVLKSVVTEEWKEIMVDKCQIVPWRYNLGGTLLREIFEFMLQIK